jgi:hypothetical protein
MPLMILPVLGASFGHNHKSDIFSKYLFFSFAFLAEDLQHKSFSGSVSKYSRKDKCHPDQSKNPPEAPRNEKR